MSAALDRRTFLGVAGGAAGALAAAAIAPFRARALALSAGAGSADARQLAHASAGPQSLAGEDAWHIDDMWGHMPRYAHPIPHSPARTSPVAWEHVDPIDRVLVI